MGKLVRRNERFSSIVLEETNYYYNVSRYNISYYNFIAAKREGYNYLKYLILRSSILWQFFIRYAIKCLQPCEKSNGGSKVKEYPTSFLDMLNENIPHDLAIV
jgi:hypothetical protein